MGKINGAADFEALDACHLQIQQQLSSLADLVEDVARLGAAPEVRAQARAIAAFFSQTSRKHHLEEEAQVFPDLVASDDAHLVEVVQRLLQDHFWIEENWKLLGPQLSALANGNIWMDEAEFLARAQLFIDICHDHIALEESLIYPESKQRLARSLAAREERLKANAPAT